jgi:hypothetical protein
MAILRPMPEFSGLIPIKEQVSTDLVNEVLVQMEKQSDQPFGKPKG